MSNRDVDRSDQPPEPVHAEVADQAPERPGEYLHVERFGPAHTGGAMVHVNGAVIDELVFASVSSVETLQAALLIGKETAGDEGGGVRIDGFIQRDKYANLSELCCELNQHWTQLQNRAARLGKGRRVLGWFASVPGCDGVLSDALQLVHRTFFNLPMQVVLLMDPAIREARLYGFDEEGALINTGFNVLRARQGAASVCGSESRCSPDELPPGYGDL